MSLIYCPECGHEISQAAIACPSCGRPINAAPPTVDRVMVAKQPDREGFPPWAFVPLAILGAGLLFLFFYMMQRDETAESNLNVNVSTQRASTRSRDADRTGDSHTTTIPSDGTTITTEPPSSQTVTVPGSQTTVPETKGRAVIEAKVASRTGQPQAVKNEKFYLLDEDLETILSEARLEPIEGQTLANSFGLSVVYPERFGDFNRKALAAIRDHIKYSGTTDATGKAQLTGIEPDSYYLFGITKTGRGFALWSNPVTIQTGENILNLSPQRITEMETASE